MKKLGKIVIPFFIIFVVIVGFYFLNVDKKNVYSYKWVKEDKSVLNQYYLYLINSRGKKITGRVEIVYLNNKSEYMTISTNGKLFIKSTIKEVRNIKEVKK